MLYKYLLINSDSTNMSDDDKESKDGNDVLDSNSDETQITKTNDTVDTVDTDYTVDNVDTKKDAKIPRKPGRPRKKPANQPKPKSGVVAKPTDAQHYIEFLYDEQMVFKKLWQFFKLMAVSNIHMVFSSDCIFIYCKDHHQKSDIRVKIDCNLVNHYYCKNELDIGVCCENLTKIMSTIDKNYNSILFLSTCDNIQKNIQVVLKN